MNYFSMVVSDEGCELLYEGDPLFLIRNAGQAVADNPESANLLIGVVAQAMYCNNQISETQLDEILNCVADEEPIKNFEMLEDIWWEQDDEPDF